MSRRYHWCILAHLTISQHSESKGRTSVQARQMFVKETAALIE